MKAIFLAAFREPRQTMLAMLDFRINPIDQVIDRVLEMDKNSNYMWMGTLQRALSKEEDIRFLQEMQCITCLNLGHSTLECTMRTQCMPCHYRSHTKDWYNLLNRQTALV